MSFENSLLLPHEDTSAPPLPDVRTTGHIPWSVPTSA